MLLENSANVNASDSHMWTPLHCAAKYSQVGDTINKRLNSFKAVVYGTFVERAKAFALQKISGFQIEIVCSHEMKEL